MDNHERLIRAVQRATRKLASSGEFDRLLREVLAICLEAVGAQNGTIYVHDAASQRLIFRHVLPESIREKLPTLDIPEDFGIAGEAFISNRSVSREYPAKPRENWTELELATGVQVRSILATPLSMEDEKPIGVVQLINKDDGHFTPADVAVMDTVSAVATMAFLNAQLVEQNARAATLLGMGKVSHDIGNLAASLYATLGFGEMAIHGIRDHLQKTKPDRQMRLYVDTIEPIFRELKESVDRLVGYSRLISDISAGRPVRPEFQLGALADVVYQAASYFEWQGRSQHIEIRYELAEHAPATRFDEVFVSRIVQNLVGNAIKAVRETLPVDLPLVVDDEPTEALGWITVGYQFECGQHRITVRDTGPGMTDLTIRQILSGTARSQWERAGGSGWGLRIVQELAAAMGGEVRIESELGQGAEFCVVLPHDPGEQESDDEKIPAQAAA